ncbi:hypothetical protein NWFMUON74_51770 [Nocardia wallacei]|uniref:Uncharacterized protein n=1 Tax=Nocardia wallacei TaxID=480035 RepID=A0A7G1KQ61_9NOCA|nr:hypothetical protein NWFMUON74_51770 [Nocardia wallacei]
MTLFSHEDPRVSGYGRFAPGAGSAGWNAAHAMHGREFSGGGELVGGFLRGLTALPPAVAGVLFVGALLVGMAGCTAAMVTQPDYGPSPNICRHDQLATRAELSGDCVAPTTLPGVAR